MSVPSIVSAQRAESLVIVRPREPKREARRNHPRRERESGVMRRSSLPENLGRPLISNEDDHEKARRRRERDVGGQKTLAFRVIDLI